jgi:small subunit ribosomal protein S17
MTMIEREEEQNEQGATGADAAPEEQATPDQPEPAGESPEEPEAEARADAEPAAEARPAPAEPEEALSPKERRRRARSRHTGEARPQREPEERARERAERRRRKAATRRAWRARKRERRKATGAAGPARTAPAAGPGGRPRERHGVVVSDKADKTITVRIDVTRRHRTYKKIVRESSTLHAHDARNEAGVGDTVRVVESRPLSRTKRWRLLEVTERAR